MSSTPAPTPTSAPTRSAASDPVERGSFRDRIRRKPGIGHAWRVGVFLRRPGLHPRPASRSSVLPGPLTIPPVLLGLWIWSTEFEWAHRFFAAVQGEGQGGLGPRQAAPGQLHRASRSLGLVLAGVGDLGDRPLPPRRTAAKTSSGWPEPDSRWRTSTGTPSWSTRHAGPCLGGRHVARRRPGFYAPRALWQRSRPRRRAARRPRPADQRPGPTARARRRDGLLGGRRGAPPTRLRLRALSRLPGTAYLDIGVRAHGARTELSVRTTFEPAGLAGHAYWWADRRRAHGRRSR